MIFNVQPQTDGYFCVWSKELAPDRVMIQSRGEDGAPWQTQAPRHAGRAFVPASRAQSSVLRLVDGGQRPLSAEIRCSPRRERLRDRLPARVPFSNMRRFHSWQRFAAYTRRRGPGLLTTLDGATVAADAETANGLYLVAGAPALFSRAVDRELLEHPTHAPALTRAAARAQLWRAPPVIQRAALDVLPAAARDGLGAFAPEAWLVPLAANLQSRILRLRAPDPHGGVAIYHEGHTGSGSGIGRETIRWLLARGWHVCCVDMLLCGLNLPDRGGQFADHNGLWRLAPADPCAPLAAMVAPLRALTDLLAQEGARPPLLLGRSGGGMMAYLYAALDERIGACVSLAGGVPLSQRLEIAATDLGDYEQFAPAFFDLVRHEDLMLAAAQRPLLLAYNAHDSDCFALPVGHRLGTYLQREALRHGCRLHWFVDAEHRAHSFGAAGYAALERFLAEVQLGP
jgi:dienelactone hydrolase